MFILPQKWQVLKNSGMGFPLPVSQDTIPATLSYNLHSSYIYLFSCIDLLF